MQEEIANVSGNIPGTGAESPAGKPANFGDAIVNPAAAKRWKAINKTHTGGILRRKKPNLMAENKVYAIATRTRNGRLRGVPDTRFDSEISARNYGDKYHRGKSGERFYEVIEHPDSAGKKRRLKEDCDTFAGAIVFEVSSSTFHNAKTEKRRGKHWRTYLDECDELAEIREYANKHPKKPIVLRNRTTSEMVYVRYGKAR